MPNRAYWMSAGIVMLVASSWAAPTHALSMHECSVKYKAAQASGTLGGMGWRDFRRAQCGPGASPAPAAAPSGGGMFGGGSAGTQQQGATPGGTSSYSPSYFNPGPVVGGGNAIFPTAISPKYAGQSIGRARMHTCLDQYRANKATGGNGSLKWIQKGGGYYSLCNRRLGGR